MSNLKYIYEVLIEKVDKDAVEHFDLDELFGAMQTVDDVKVIIIGQDSYPDPEKVTSMAFSYRRGQPATGSVKEIILAALKGKDDHDDRIVSSIKDGYLGSWRDQGVLLLNSDSLAVVGLIKHLIKASKGRICGICLGTEAQKLSTLFDTVFCWNHPSRKSTINNNPDDPRHWNHTDVFWRANLHITESGRCPINWATVTGSTTLWVFTDGGYSTKQSEGQSGCAIFNSIQSYLGHSVIRGKDINTNNVAELKAIILGLEIVYEYTMGKVVVVSDSEYSIKSITIWHPQRKLAKSSEELAELDEEIEEILARTTKKKTSKASKTKVVKNVELIEYAMKLTEEIKCRYIHIHGHTAEPINGTTRERFLWRGNDFVDKLVGYH